MDFLIIQFDSTIKHIKKPRIPHNSWLNIKTKFFDSLIALLSFIYINNWLNDI